MTKTVIVTGSQGFIGTYLCLELLKKGYNVVGIDNFSKYGRVVRPHDKHANFQLFKWDLVKGWPGHYWLEMREADYIIAGAAMIGGISYFHKYAYDLLATNERINANTFDGAIELYKKGFLKRLVVISSSMVYEGADTERDKLSDMADQSCCGPENFDDPESVWPSKESDVEILPPPHSTYGFQKLAAEYFCKGAYEQYGLPYTIVRPFNCVGVGEEEALGEAEVSSGNVKLMLSHVLPDLINKCLKGQDPLHILGKGDQVRCYTNGKDIARGIVMAMESEAGLNNDFNISTSRPTTVLELAELVWNEINPDKPFRYVSDKAFKYDVQKRIPDVSKAKELLGFETKVSLETSIREVVEYMNYDARKDNAGDEKQIQQFRCI